MVWTVLLLASVCCAGIPKLIIDTDMSTDCDDVGAVCIANAMADNGEVDLIAVMHNTGLNTGAGAVSVLNTYYGRSHVPIGAYKGTFGATERGAYVDDLVASFPSPIKNSSQVPDALVVYRTVLAQQPDASVVIASIGFTVNMAALLKSPPDAISPLSGAELVAKKVRAVGWMGGNFPSATGSWNFCHDNSGPYTEYCVENWPKETQLMFSGGEIGDEIKTGGVMTNGTPLSNPCRRAYVDRQGPGRNRSSWDPATTLWAVRGLQHLWDSGQGTNHVNATGSCTNTWTSGGRMEYLIKKADPLVVAKQIDDLLLQPPKNTD